MPTLRGRQNHVFRGVESPTLCGLDELSRRSTETPDSPAYVRSVGVLALWLSVQNGSDVAEQCTVRNPPSGFPVLAGEHE